MSIKSTHWVVHVGALVLVVATAWIDAECLKVWHVKIAVVVIVAVPTTTAASPRVWVVSAHVVWHEASVAAARSTTATAAAEVVAIVGV